MSTTGIWERTDIGTCNGYRNMQRFEWTPSSPNESPRTRLDVGLYATAMTKEFVARSQQCHEGRVVSLLSLFSPKTARASRYLERADKSPAINQHVSASR